MNVNVTASPVGPADRTVAKPPASFEELSKAHPDAAQAAQQFEAVFLRQLMSSVEKTAGMGKTSETRGAVVGSMMVGALSDKMSSAGGIGLSEVILRAMVENLPEEKKSSPTPPVATTEQSAQKE